MRVITVRIDRYKTFQAYLVDVDYSYGGVKFEEDGSFLLWGHYQFPNSPDIVDFEIFQDRSGENVKYSYPMYMKSWVSRIEEYGDKTLKSKRLIFYAERGDEEEGLEIDINYKGEIIDPRWNTIGNLDFSGLHSVKGE